VSEGLDEQRLRRLIAVGRSLVSERDLETLLSQVLDAARELTGARYAALGVLDEQRKELERFLTRGIDPATHRAIGDLPRGRGILGLLIEDPQPLRLHDLHRHPRSFGFPANHPPMHSFLGVPIMIRGNAWGNLYLTDKAGGDFDAADEQTAIVLADWAAVAIENANLYHRLQTRRDELERVVQSLEATTAIARAVGAETQIDRVLELIVKRGRALVDARAMLILLRTDEEELTVVACAGEVETTVIGQRMPVEDSTSGEILRSSQPERIRDVPGRLRISAERLGVDDAQTALLVPLAFRGRGLGVLVAFDRIGADPEFGSEQEALLLAFAASAATAVATAQSVEHQRLRESMASAEQERRRWARELHDETLQGLAGLQVLLSSALRRDAPGLEQTVRLVVEQIGTEIGKLRMLITELRPAALDELGLQPAIESLASRVAAVEGLEVETEVSVGDGERRLAPELETAAYRIVQEALTNVVKHAGAEHVSIEIAPRDGGVEVTVRDDGAGFDPELPREGFGLTGMRERVGLCDGTLTIESSPRAGTTVQAWLRSDVDATTRVA
jgi:signal transduction histidine kinase